MTVDLRTGRTGVSIVVACLCLLLSFVDIAQGSEDGRGYIDIHGTKIDLHAYRGKWVVINYWATWCPPCLAEIPELILFHESHKNSDAVVLGFNMEETSVSALSRFAEENMMNYPVIPMRGDAPLIGDIPGLPTTYMIDPEGRTVARKVGQVSMDMLENFIKNNN